MDLRERVGNALGQQVGTPGLGPRVCCPQYKSLSLTVPGVPGVLTGVQEEGPSQHPTPLPHIRMGTNPSFWNCGKSCFLEKHSSRPGPKPWLSRRRPGNH